MHNNSNIQPGGILPTGVPGARSQYYGFGRDFYKSPNILTVQHTSNIEREAWGEYRTTAGGAGPASVATAAADARWRNKTTASKKGGGIDVKVSVKPGWRRRVPPTLLEIHQRVIDAALLEISRPREGPFENLGERLGGEHETFTYYSRDGVGGGKGTNAESTACDPNRLPGGTTPKRRAPTASGKQRTLMCTRDRPRPSTRPRFNTRTADGPRQMDLPRCNKSWKIPLLRTSWTPSNDSSRDITGNPFGDIEYGLLGSGLSGSYKEGPTGAASGSAENDAQSNAAAGASEHLDGVKEQGVDNALRPRAGSTASLPIESLPVSRIPASQDVEEKVSTALLSPLLAADAVYIKGIKEQAHAKSDALSWDGASEVGAPVSRAAAKHYVEEAMSHALRGAFLVVSGQESLSMKAVEKVQRDISRSREQVDIGLEARVMAHEYSGEYLRRGLQARLAGASGEGVKSSQTQVDTTTMRTCPPEINGHLIENVSPVFAQPDAFGKSCHISIESGATTPTSWITSTMSSDSSSIEFILNDDSSAGNSCLGGEMQLDRHDGTGVGDSSSSARAEALTYAATTAVGEWVSGVLFKSARATTQRTSAGVTSDQHETIRGTGNAAQGQPPLCYTDISAGGPMKMLPLGFLKDIVERRASLKPVVDSRPASASVEDDRRLESDSRKQRERCAQHEASERARALQELETLASAEGLDIYDPCAFSRGALYGEGRHSVVYSAYAARLCGNGKKTEHQDTPGTASTAVMFRHAAAATMAREASVEVVTTAVAARVTTRAVSSVSTIAMIVSTALIESVIPASISAVAATTLETNTTVLAAKEFRYARADVPVSILRKAHREVSMHLRVAGCTHIVALRGVWLTPRVTLLLEPLGGGNLHHFFRNRAAEEKARNDKNTGGRVEHDKQRQHTSVEAAWLVAEAAEGLAALHSAGVVHRDVKSHNVMVAKRQQGITESTKFMPGWEAKLGDLGSATLIPPGTHAALMEETGTSGWMAPEVRLVRQNAGNTFNNILLNI